MSVSRVSLGSQIAARLRREILYGVRQPGEMLQQEAICRELGTSRMPVRDAFRQLVFQGFLVAEVNGKLRIAELDDLDVQDMFDVEAVLHGMAARRASQRCVGVGLEQLWRLNEEMSARVSHHDIEHAAELNWQFHREINHLACSPKIRAALKAVSLNLGRDFLVRQPEWAERAIPEHDAIVDAMQSCAHDEVERLMADHIRQSGRYLADNLRAVRNQHLESDGVGPERAAAAVH